MHNQTVFVLVNVQVYQITNQTNKIERLEEFCFFTIESRWNTMVAHTSAFWSWRRTVGRRETTKTSLKGQFNGWTIKDQW